MIESRFVARRGRGQDALQRGAKKLLRMKDIFVILILIMVSQVYTHVKTNQTACFAYVSSRVLQLELNKFEKGKKKRRSVSLASSNQKKNLYLTK